MANDSGKTFPCPQCGARLDFDPSVSALKCPYCSYQKEIVHEDPAPIVEHDFREFQAKIREVTKSGGIQSLAGHTNQIRCTGCGAVVLLEDKVVTDQCPFCHTHLDKTSEKIEGLIEPESVLPFRIDLRKARSAFSEWLESLWFAPTVLKKIANLGELTGVYLPYWTYDSLTNTSYVGQRGENYIDYETYTVTDADGKTRTETRAVTRTRWWPASGEVEHFFDDVLVCGSKSLPEDLIRDLEPWDLPKLEPFKADYLSGFKTERYGVDLEAGMKIAKDLMEPEINRLIRRDIGGDQQIISSKKTRYSKVTFKHTLLPVWVAVYRFQERVFQILVNGRTGKVVGHRPWSAWKIARLVGLITLGAVIIFVIVRHFAN